ncbi:MAG: CDP-alcohol phosphatidyltransferase family protein, partial [Geodermatophilaceae bacterium]|nr:CDP-alcohol phosphatidyltransferase family protein [Geodermatophilaceae bacterium]
MFDTALRRALASPLDRVAARLDVGWLSPDRLTASGLVLGLGSAITSALGCWAVAVVLWLASRLADGLDGPLARRRRARGQGGGGSGGFFDITADFTVYGATVVG